jgi:hypothetical protein
MQRLSSGFVAVLSILALSTAPACKGDKADAGDAKADADDAKADAGDAKADDESAPAEAGEAEAGTEVGAGEGAEAEAEAGETQAGTEAGAGEAGTEAGAGETGEEDPVPALLETAKSLDSDDEAATKALAAAIDAGAPKLDAAKVANARGEALMTKGESERAETFFVWARDTHNLYADPVYNLAKLAAYAGDLAVAKEHLQELQKRGNKKLMKKVGVDPAFAPLQDDPEVRKIYEQ